MPGASRAASRRPGPSTLGCSPTRPAGSTSSSAQATGFARSARPHSHSSAGTQTTAAIVAASSVSSTSSAVLVTATEAGSPRSRSIATRPATSITLPGMYFPIIVTA